MDALPANTLESLLNPAKIEVRNPVPQIREQMIWEAACSLGARGGLADRSQTIRATLERLSSKLDRLSFQPLMTKEGMLPPVVSEEIDSVRQEGEKDKRAAGVIYRMVHEAQLVMIAPTWRDYFFSGFPAEVKVEMPHKSFFPANEGEKVVWVKAVTECWKSGVLQADSIFNENASRFDRDYVGMLRYKHLARQGMGESLKVGTDIREVSGNKTEMVIDDQRYRILGSGGLVPDAGKWK